MYRIGFYETETGRSPVVDFLNEMSSKARAKFAQIAIYFLRRKALKSRCRIQDILKMVFLK